MNTMEDVNTLATLAQDRAEFRRVIRWIAFWILIGFMLGFSIGYGVFAMRDHDAAERYRQHIIQYHSGRHQGV